MAERGEPLSQADVDLLTEARTARWRLEAVEYAYDASVRSIVSTKTVLEFLAVLVAVLFLFLQYLATRENYPVAHDLLGYIGAAASLAVILMVIWGYMARWPDQIDKKRELSSGIHDMLGKHRALSEERPLDHAKLRKWIGGCEAFEEKRKHELATVSRYFLMRGFQHVGNKYPRSGVTCSLCGQAWTTESNRKAWKAYLPFGRCRGCGT